MKNPDISKNSKVKVVQRQSRESATDDLSSEKALEVGRSHSRKHVAPPALAELIQLVNLLKDAPLDLVEQAKQESDNYAPVVKRIIDGLPSELRARVGKYPVDYKDLGLRVKKPGLDSTLQRMQADAIKQYEELVTVKRVLYYLAHDQWSSATELIASMSHKWSVTSEGRLTAELNWPASCLQNVEVHLIRECPVCKKIYWADRIDKPTCSTRHNNVRWSWIRRGTHTEELNRPYYLPHKNSTNQESLTEEE